MAEPLDDGSCQNCGMVVIGYGMFEFMDTIIKNDGTVCPYCGAPDWRRRTEDLAAAVAELKADLLRVLRPPLDRLVGVLSWRGSRPR